MFQHPDWSAWTHHPSYFRHSSFRVVHGTQDVGQQCCVHTRVGQRDVLGDGVDDLYRQAGITRLSHVARGRFAHRGAGFDGHHLGDLGWQVVQIVSRTEADDEYATVQPRGYFGAHPRHRASFLSPRDDAVDGGEDGMVMPGHTSTLVPAFSGGEWPACWRDSLATNVTRVKDRLVPGPGAVGALGKVVVDQVVVCDQAPAADSHQNVSLRVTAGGAPANVTAGVASRGGAAILAGWAGVDGFSEHVVDDLSLLGVDVRLVRRDRAPVATVVAWHGDRAFLVDQGTLRARLDDVREEWLAGMAVMHLNGFELLSYCWPEVLAAAADLAHRAGIVVTVDCPTANRLEADGVEQFRAALAAVRPDVVFCNAAEADVIGVSGSTAMDLATSAVIVHAGVSPTVMHTAQDALTVPVPRDLVVEQAETTGCGDAFAAGVLHASTHGANLIDAVGVGHLWAAEQARIPGAQPVAPTAQAR